MKKWIGTLIAAGFFILAGMALAVENKGADNMQLEGGSRGEVPFPHHRHQSVLGSCTQCHDVFPQKNGAIAEMKAAGTLKPKAVMNKQCINCHRARKKEGQTSGPTSCAKCHTKKG